MTRLADDTGAWQVVVDRAAADPIAHDQASATGMRCALCDATPHGATTATAWHLITCPWRAAVELIASATGNVRPPE